MKIEKIRDDIELPIIDLHYSNNRSQTSKLIVKACEEYGFFKVINHGVPHQIMTCMDDEAREFFSKPGPEKQKFGPANPYGYGFKNIGLNGDMGEVEYLLLHTKPPFISNCTVSNKFSNALSSYLEAVRELACEILDLIGEGLFMNSSSSLSGLIKDVDSDSLLRLNHYPPFDDPSSCSSNNFKIGFGEHTDPQILTLLTSNDVQGLQISLEDGVWVPVNPLPQSAFCVNVGDLLQVMTNGRFLSVRHRAIVNSYKSRTSIGYFAAPPLNATISCLPAAGLGADHHESQNPPTYRSFTWGEYKKATYSKRLGDCRLNHFKLPPRV